MKKNLSMLLALLMFSVLAVSAFADTATTAGTDTLGYIDFASCKDVLGEAQVDDAYNFMIVSSSDSLNLARIMITFEDAGNNTDFNAVKAYIRNQYTAKAFDDDRYNYTNIVEEQVELSESSILACYQMF